MPAIEEFNRLMEMAPVTYFSDPKRFVNDAQQRTYIIAQFLMGKGAQEVIRGGPKIREDILLDGASTLSEYGPEEDLEYASTQPGKRMELPWAYLWDYMQWNDHEVEHSMAEGMTQDSRAKIFKDIYTLKEMALANSILNGFDSRVCAVPDYANMEQATADEKRKMFSIFSFVNEDTNGNWNSEFTTLQGLSPALTNYAPVKKTYTGSDTVDNETGVLAGFRKLHRSLQFHRPALMSDKFEPATMSRDFFYLTGPSGADLYEAALAASGDRFRTVARNDASWGGAFFDGVPIIDHDPLDTLALYDDGSSGRAALAGAALTKPRFYAINTKYMKLLFHAATAQKGGMLKDMGVIHPERQLGTHIRRFAMWTQLICTSRRRHGVLSPSDNPA